MGRGCREEGDDDKEMREGRGEKEGKRTKRESGE